MTDFSPVPLWTPAKWKQMQDDVSSLSGVSTDISGLTSDVSDLNADVTSINASLTALDSMRVSVIAQSGAPVSLTGTTNETTMATITIPGGAMGANGQIIVDSLWTYPSTANNKIMRVKFGGTTYQAVTATTTLNSSQSVRIANKNATNSQMAPSTGIIGSGAQNFTPATSSVDTTSPVTLLLTGQLALGTETLILQSYSVRLYKAV